MAKWLYIQPMTTQSLLLPGLRSDQQTQRTFDVCSTERLFGQRLLNGSKRQIGAFAIANKDGGAHGVFFITEKSSISPRGWAIRGVLEDIC